ncbi:hypothetical protein GY652_26995, partial [Escherichia coli]|uniref:hypothetical protein n=1 Tax=Escherichia coli TaxID=562 RepID=UPI00180BBE3E
AKRKTYVDTRKKYFETLAAADPAATEMLEKNLLPAVQAYIAVMKDFGAYERELVKSAVDEAQQNIRTQRMLVLGLSALAVLVGLLVAWRT